MSSETTEKTGGSKHALFPDLVRHNALALGSAPAVLMPDARLDWDALDAQSDGVAKALRRDGVGAGDRVALLAKASIEYVVVLVGALKAGASIVPLSTMITDDILSRLVLDSGASVIFSDTANRARFDRAFSGKIIRITAGAPAEDWLSLAVWTANSEEIALPDLEASSSAEFNVIYSSGTTGAPKGIVHNNDLRAKQIEAFRAFGLNSDTKTILTTALYTNYSLLALLATLGAGGAVYLLPRFDAGAFIEACHAEALSHAFLVPVQIKRILEHADFARLEAGRDMRIFSAGSPLRVDIKRDVVSRWPGLLIEIYGATEGGASTLLVANQYPDKLASVGHASSGCKIKILREDGTEAEPGESGEIVGRSAMTMDGYLGREEESAKLRWVSPDGETYMRSGDIGFLDEDGFLYLTDRAKDVIISGGLNVFASDLEAVLSGHPDVLDCAVVAAASERWGETPVAFAVLSGRDAASPQDLLEWVNAQLSKHQRLAEIIPCDELPRNMMGKIMKQTMREKLRQQRV